MHYQLMVWSRIYKLLRSRTYVYGDSSLNRRASEKYVDLWRSTEKYQIDIDKPTFLGVQRVKINTITKVSSCVRLSLIIIIVWWTVIWECISVATLTTKILQ